MASDLDGDLVGHHAEERLIPEIEGDVFFAGIKPELPTERHFFFNRSGSPIRQRHHVVGARFFRNLQVEDFRKSPVNNLDVLQALEDLQGDRRDLVLAKAEAARMYWAVKVAAGDMAEIVEGDTR